MKAILRVTLITLLLGLMLFTTSCQKREYFKVSFETNNITKIESIEVQKGFRIIEKITPIGVDGAMFMGWYKETELINEWIFSNDLVSTDTTLYAKWLVIENYPKEVGLSKIPLSSDITWVQGNTNNETIFKVSLYEKLSDGSYSDIVTEVPGTHEIADDKFTITWSPSIRPQGGIYKVTIDTENDSTIIQQAILLDAIFKGEGSNSNPYLVYTESDLLHVSNSSKEVNTGKYYVQKETINIENNQIQENATIFNGNYDGNQQIIHFQTGNSGLFYENTGVIKNLLVTGSITTGTNASIGFITNYNSGEISSITIDERTSMVESTAGIVGDISTLELGGAGGIVGTNNKSGLIENSFNNARVSSSIGGGGIVGTNYGTIVNCVNYGRIGAGNNTEVGKGKATPSYSYSGGITGVNNGKIQKSGTSSKAGNAYAGNVFAQRNDENVPNHNIYLGGVVGLNMKLGELVEVYNVAKNIHGDQYIGGIAGRNEGKIENAYNHSVVASRYQTGGIVGQNEQGTVVNTYNIGNVLSHQDQTKAFAISEKASNSIYITNSNLVIPVGDNNSMGNATLSDFTNVLGDKFTTDGKFIWQ